jgi:hypothetical protein
MKGSARFIYAALLALLAAVLTYAYGFWVGRFLELRPINEYCTRKPLGTPPISWTWMPLSNRCRWNDGTTTDLVPWYVNVLLFVCLGVAVTLIGLAVRDALRRRRTAPQDMEM